VAPLLGAEKGLRIFDPLGTAFLLWVPAVSTENWVWVEGDRSTGVPSLITFLATLSPQPGPSSSAPQRWRKTVRCNGTLKLGPDIAQLLCGLMPLYRACLGARAKPRPGPPGPEARQRAEIS